MSGLGKQPSEPRLGLKWLQDETKTSVSGTFVSRVLPISDCPCSQTGPVSCPRGLLRRAGSALGRPALDLWLGSLTKVIKTE